MFYNFNQQAPAQTQPHTQTNHPGGGAQQYMLHQSHVIEEADAQHEHEEASSQIRKSTCTDRLQSRNGSRRVTGNRRIINYIIAHN